MEIHTQTILSEFREGIRHELARCARRFDEPPLSRIPAPYRSAVRSFIERDGKRLRPLLLLLGYTGYSDRRPAGLYRTAAALELLHDFVLIHDDIVDHSVTRRGAPSIPAALDRQASRDGVACSGRDLATIAGDMLYALGMNLFLSVDEAAERRLRALEHLTRTAVITACGELREMLVGAAAGDVPTAAEVTEISEWKTAHYSFACPLVTGAVLAGVDDDEAESLYRYAVAAGVAFQIRDDIHDIAGVSRDGSRYDDLREGTLTLPLWYALRVVPERDRVRMLQGIGSGASARVEDLAAARDIIVACGGVEYATRIAGEYAQSSREMLHDLRMAPSCRAVLADYVDGLLSGPRVGIRPAPAASGVAALEDVPRPRGTSLDGIRISVCNNMVGAPGQWAAHAGTGSDS